MKKRTIVLGGIAVVAAAAGIFYLMPREKDVAKVPLDPTPQRMTISGTYECLPHLDTTGPQTQECAFGLKADDGTHYAVNFGASADAMSQFQGGKHVTAEGFLVIKEALSTNQWDKYDMKGIFTITSVVDSTKSSQPSAKINIDAVCASALAYMSFPDAASADAFVEIGRAHV